MKPKTKQAEEAFADLLQLNFENTTLAVCLASLASGADPQYQRIDTAESLAAEFRRVVADWLDDYARMSRGNDLELVPFDAGFKPEKYQIEFLSRAEHETIHRRLAPLDSPVLEVPVFEQREDFVEGLRFYSITLQLPANKQIHFLRWYTPKRELGRSTWFGAMLQGHAFDRVKKPVFLFDSLIDCACVGSFVFVFNKAKFQGIFSFFELLRQTARETLETIAAHVPIANLTGLEEASEGHLQMLAKLKNISAKPYLTKVTIKDVKRVIKDYGLKLELVKEDGIEKVRFDPTNKWELLRLFDDDYLESTMTRRKYEASGKRLKT